jgi:hypothetical protein
LFENFYGGDFGGLSRGNRGWFINLEGPSVLFVVVTWIRGYATERAKRRAISEDDSSFMYQILRSIGPESIPTSLQKPVMLTDDSYLDISFELAYLLQNFINIRESTIQALDDWLQIGFPLSDRSMLEKISQGFVKYSLGLIKESGYLQLIDNIRN